MNLFASVFWNGVLLISAAGSQMRVGPEGFRTSARVVISNVRQVGASARIREIFVVFGNATLAETMLAERRKSRRFMDAPLRNESVAPNVRPVVALGKHIQNCSEMQHAQK